MTIRYGPRECDMRIRYGPRECDMRYAIGEYATSCANAICDTRIRYVPRECDTRMVYGPSEYDTRYANRLRAMSNCFLRHHIYYVPTHQIAINSKRHKTTLVLFQFTATTQKTAF